MTIMRSISIASLVALGLVGGGAGSRADADTLVLDKGGWLTGELQGSDLAIVTRDGVIKLALRDVRAIYLRTVSGDAVRDAQGRVTTGVVDQPSYTIRLPSGQTLVFSRADVAQIRLTPR